MKNASPIGMSNDAQISSGSSKSSSQTVRVPVGRSSGSPPRSATQLSQAQRIVPVDQLQQVAMVVVERLAAEVAALLRGLGARRRARPAAGA